MTRFSNDISTFLFNFRKWYENRNMRQEEVADQLNITKWHLSKVLNERTTPSVKLLESMAKLMEEG